MRYRVMRLIDSWRGADSWRWLDEDRDFPTLVSATMEAEQYAIDSRVETSVWAWWGYGLQPVWTFADGVDKAKLVHCLQREEECIAWKEGITC